jgi:ABC-type molybdate transport system substrate-binding protein
MQELSHRVHFHVEMRIMTKHVLALAHTVTICIGAMLGTLLTASLTQAGTLTIAVTPDSVDAVDVVAHAFEAVHEGDHVRIVVTSGTELKAGIKSLPIQLVVSDDVPLIEWMETRDFASRPAEWPAVSVPLAVVAPFSNTVAFDSTGDLINRMKQHDAVLAISDPLKTDCGRRARALLSTVGISTEPSARLMYSKHTQEVIALVRTGKAHFGLLFAPEAITAKGIIVHALSASTVSSSIHVFAVKQGQQNHVVAQRFLAFVNASEGRNAMKTRGYEPMMASRLTAAPSP